MTRQKIETYRAKLEGILEELSLQDDLGADAQKVVTLDQQSVGRLSRMDAMQGQAMANATAARRAAQIQRIKAAFERMEEGEYGYCVDCGEDIAPARLDFDPAVTLCISCAKG